MWRRRWRRYGSLLRMREEELMSAEQLLPMSFGPEDLDRPRDGGL